MTPCPSPKKRDVFQRLRTELLVEVKRRAHTPSTAPWSSQAGADPGQGRCLQAQTRIADETLALRPCGTTMLDCKALVYHPSAREPIRHFFVSAPAGDLTLFQWIQAGVKVAIVSLSGLTTTERGNVVDRSWHFGVSVHSPHLLGRHAWRCRHLILCLRRPPALLTISAGYGPVRHRFLLCPPREPHPTRACGLSIYLPRSSLSQLPLVGFFVEKAVSREPQLGL